MILVFEFEVKGCDFLLIGFIKLLICFFCMVVIILCDLDCCDLLLGFLVGMMLLVCFELDVFFVEVLVMEWIFIWIDCGVVVWDLLLFILFIDMMCSSSNYYIIIYKFFF